MKYGHIKLNVLKPYNYTQENIDWQNLSYEAKLRLLADVSGDRKDFKDLAVTILNKADTAGFKFVGPNVLAKRRGAKYTYQFIKYTTEFVKEYVQAMPRNSLKQFLSEKDSRKESLVQTLENDTLPIISPTKLFIEFRDGVVNWRTLEFEELQQFKASGGLCFYYLDSSFKAFLNILPGETLKYLLYQFETDLHLQHDLVAKKYEQNDVNDRLIYRRIYRFCYLLGLASQSPDYLDVITPSQYKVVHLEGEPGSGKSLITRKAFINFFGVNLVGVQERYDSKFSINHFENKKLVIFDEFDWFKIAAAHDLHSQAKLMEMLEIRTTINATIPHHPSKQKPIVWKVPVILLGTTPPPRLTSSDPVSLAATTQELVRIGRSNDAFLRRTESFCFPMSIKDDPVWQNSLEQEQISFIFFCAAVFKNLHSEAKVYEFLKSLRVRLGND